jgi:hypothetical protein
VEQKVDSAAQNLALFLHRLSHLCCLPLHHPHLFRKSFCLNLFISQQLHIIFKTLDPVEKRLVTCLFLSESPVQVVNSLCCHQNLYPEIVNIIFLFKYLFRPQFFLLHQIRQVLLLQQRNAVKGVFVLKINPLDYQEVFFKLLTSSLKLSLDVPYPPLETVALIILFL